MTRIDCDINISFMRKDSKYCVKGVYSSLLDRSIHSRIKREVAKVSGLTIQECRTKVKRIVDEILVNEYPFSKICGVGGVEGMVGGKVECRDILDE